MVVTQSKFLTLKDLINKSCESCKVPRCSCKLSTPGVYVWGFSLETQPFTPPSSASKFVPYYVGKSYCVFKRFYEHLSVLKGGGYPIFDILSSHKLSNCNFGALVRQLETNYKQQHKQSNNCSTMPNNSATNSAKSSSLLYYPAGAHVYDAFLGSRIIQSQIDWMFEHIVFTYFTSVNYSLQLEKDRVELENRITQIIGKEYIISGGHAKPNNDLKVELLSGDITINIAEKEHIYQGALLV